MSLPEHLLTEQPSAKYLLTEPVILPEHLLTEHLLTEHVLTESILCTKDLVTE